MTLPENWNEEDTEHPIPYPGKIDVLTTTVEGTTYYGLVIAAPMEADERSQRRLLKKLEDYASDRHSQKAIYKYGKPTPQNTRLTVAVHPGSSQAIFELLTRCLPWLEECGFKVEVTTDAKILSLH